MTFWQQLRYEGVNSRDGFAQRVPAEECPKAAQSQVCQGGESLWMTPDRSPVIPKEPAAYL